MLRAHWDRDQQSQRHFGIINHLKLSELVGRATTDFMPAAPKLDGDGDEREVWLDPVCDLTNH
jgi:hypothetical protein